MIPSVIAGLSSDNSDNRSCYNTLKQMLKLFQQWN